MTFTSEESSKIKEQIIEQINQVPNENNKLIIEKINSFNEKELEDFLKQNNIEFIEGGLKQIDSNEKTEDKPIFELIISEKIPSFKITENSKAIAILEINPLSKGHIIIIPKKNTSIEKMPKSALTLAQKMGKKLKSKLKADDIKIETFSFQNYSAINVIPIYKDRPLKKYKEDESELKKLKNKLETKTRAKRKIKEKIENIKTKNNLLEFKERSPY
ncbi:MAG: HIT domain-containing protein [Nanoarchaeota archaeon]